MFALDPLTCYYLCDTFGASDVRAASRDLIDKQLPSFFDNVGSKLHRIKDAVVGFFGGRGGHKSDATERNSTVAPQNGGGGASVGTGNNSSTATATGAGGGGGGQGGGIVGRAAEQRGGVDGSRAEATRHQHLRSGRRQGPWWLRVREFSLGRAWRDGSLQRKHPANELPVDTQVEGCDV